ncbi:MAG: HEAT repeat domain-containing protein [Phycisphaerae bacterium]|nr:HEAT repeat domain-containing protein [Phycisphaerae bacterium]
MTLSDLDSEDEALRRWAAIDISKSRDATYEQELLRRFSIDPSEGVRRHIVRALGNIRSSAAVPLLLDILTNGSGLIVGDAAEALGCLREPLAREPLERLRASEIDWVRNKATWALKQLDQR